MPLWEGDSESVGVLISVEEESPSVEVEDPSEKVKVGSVSVTGADSVEVDDKIASVSVSANNADTVKFNAVADSKSAAARRIRRDPSIAISPFVSAFYKCIYTSIIASNSTRVNKFRTKVNFFSRSRYIFGGNLWNRPPLSTPIRPAPQLR